MNKASVDKIGDSFASIYPFWRGDTMVNETVCLVKREDGRISAKLLFEPLEIICVYDNSLTKKYVEGKDYILDKETSEILFVEGSKIKYFTQYDLEGKYENGEYIPGWDGKFDELGRSRFGNALYCVSAFLYEKQIAVTYKFKKGSWNGPQTHYQGDQLPNTMNKLKNKEKMHIVFFGDSIFTGCDSSSMYNRAPNQKSFIKLVPEALSEYYGAEISLHNPSVGGTNSEWGVSAKEQIMDGGIPDLVFLGFGMNGIDGEGNVKNLNEIISFVKEKNPDCEFVVTACMCPNANAGFLTTQWQLPDAYSKMVAPGIAYMDMFNFHKKLLERKEFCETSGNHINHPNDWLIRCYGMNLLSIFVDFDNV